MGGVLCKPGAEIRRLAPAGARILDALTLLAYPRQDDLVLSSTSEPRGRLVTDPHMTGEAFDVSIDGMTPEDILFICERLALLLGPGFYLQFETPPDAIVAPSLHKIRVTSAAATGAHIHIQRAKGTVFTPPTPPQSIRV